MKSLVHTSVALCDGDITYCVNMLMNYINASHIYNCCTYLQTKDDVTSPAVNWDQVDMLSKYDQPFINYRGVIEQRLPSIFPDLTVVREYSMSLYCMYKSWDIVAAVRQMMMTLLYSSGP